MRISDWSSDVCSSDLPIEEGRSAVQARAVGGKQRDIGAGAHAAQMIIRFAADFIVGHLLRSEGRLRANDPVGGRDYCLDVDAALFEASARRPTPHPRGSAAIVDMTGYVFRGLLQIGPNNRPG